jgi:hypothetical protein
MQCDKCKDDQKEFNTYKTCIESYLTEDEIKTYDKCLRIKKFILETIPHGIKEINWKELKEQGELSRHDEEIFAKELAA